MSPAGANPAGLFCFTFAMPTGANSMTNEYRQNFVI
jgi:hypothetical protein